MAQGEDDFLGELIRVFHLRHLGDELLRRGQEVYPLDQVGREMILQRFVPGVPDGEQQRPQSLPLKLEDLAHAERLRESGKSLENVGELRLV